MELLQWNGLYLWHEGRPERQQPKVCWTMHNLIRDIWWPTAHQVEISLELSWGNRGKYRTRGTCKILSLQKLNVTKKSFTKKLIKYHVRMLINWNISDQTLNILQKSAKNLKSEIDLTKNVHKSFRDFVKTTMSAEFR